MELNAPETFDYRTFNNHTELPSLYFPQQISLDLKRANVLKHQEEKLSLIRIGTICLTHGGTSSIHHTFAIVWNARNIYDRSDYYTSTKSVDPLSTERLKAFIDSLLI